MANNRIENISNIETINDFSEILDIYGLSYQPIEYYWQVGQIKKTQGWIIHLCVVSTQLSELIQLIVPELLSKNIAFKIVRDINTATDLLEGSYGYTMLGKLISIYPENDYEALTLVKDLKAIVSPFKGPSIPTDRNLGGIIYTRYGSFNPIYIKNDKGEIIKHIYATNGQLIADPYSIPFKLPENITWPFTDIISPEISKRGRLLNYKYYPLYALKSDAKGDVIKGLYFKHLWQIKSCVIKQGRPNMFSDDQGRDIQDRLRWQYDLYKQLHKYVPMPNIFDLFEQDDSVYLAMEFIKGQSFTTWLVGIFNSRSWLHLSKADKKTILTNLLTIADIIIRLHQEGFVHRDITPENFLLTQKNEIVLIDMELAWSSKNPAPPFQLGSPGHMSPEQMAAKTPTVKEDVYGFGSLMIVFFTGLSALKFQGMSSLELRGCLEFFIGDPEIANLLTSCWNILPANRPNLSDIKDALTKHQASLNLDLENKYKQYKKTGLTVDRIYNIIQSAINYLGSPGLQNHKSRWISQSMHQEQLIGNNQLTMDMYEGWHTGMAGPLWLTALAKTAGFSIDSCHSPYFKSWEYIEENYFSIPERMTPGLYTGNAGIALALSEGLKSAMLPCESQNIELLTKCFEHTSSKSELADGVAGQGLALLHSTSFIEKELFENLLQLYTTQIITNQKTDGSWNSYTGIDYGISGILLFLLSGLERHPESIEIKLSVNNAFKWLEKIRNKNIWPIHSQKKHTEIWKTSIGVPGVILSYIRGFEVLKEPHLKEVAYASLKSIHAYPLKMNLTLSSGLTGLGEVYREAYRVFQDELWLERANWIAQIIVNLFKKADSASGHWQVNINSISTADFFAGNSGIIHFLMHYILPEIKHPLT